MAAGLADESHRQVRSCQADASRQVEGEGVYNPELMVQMYGLILQKRLDGFSRMERDYIENIGRRAYVRTIEVLKRKEGEG